MITGRVTTIEEQFQTTTSNLVKMQVGKTCGGESSGLMETEQ